MRQSFKFFMPVAVAALAFASCQKEVETPTETPAETVHITVKASPEAIKGDAETKTYIGTYNGTANTIIWGKNEYMTIMVQSAEDKFAFATSGDENASSFDGEDQAYFEFDLTPASTATSYTYGGVYPASCAIDYNAATPYNSNKNGAAFKVSLPATQNATADSYDPSAYIMIAKPEPSAIVKTDWTASYRRATALNKVTLKNIPEDIVSVEFTAPAETYMAGRRYVNLTTGESGDLYGDTRTETIQVNAELTGSEKVVWFTSWETVIPAGQKFKIVAKSETKSYTRELTAKTKGISFKEGYLNTLSVDMSVDTQVEDLVDLKGDYLILAMPEEWRLMTSTNTSNYYGLQTTSVKTTAANVAYSDFAAVSNLEDYVWKVAKVEGGYSIQSAKTSKYVTLTANSNNAYAGDNAEAFELSIDESTHAAVIKSKTYSDRVLRYNSSSPRFAFYAGTQQPVYMVKVVEDSRTPVTLAFAETAITKTTDDYAEFTGQAVTVSSPESTEAQAAILAGVTYAISENSITSSFNTSTGALVLNGAVGSATITASYPGDESNYRPAASVSYTLKVNKAASGDDIVYTLVIDKDSFTDGSYANNNGEHTTNATATGKDDIAVTWVSSNVQQANSSIHWKSNDGYIYNKTDLGNITSVSIDSENESDYTVYIGAAQQPTSDAGEGGFFYIKTPKVSGGDYSGAVTITFTVSASEPALTEYDINITKPDGASIVATVGGNSVVKAAAGAEVTLTVRDFESGYSFGSWNVTGVSVGSTNPVTFTMPANAVNVEVNLNKSGDGDTPTFHSESWSSLSTEISSYASGSGTVVGDLGTWTYAGIVTKGQTEHSNTFTSNVMTLGSTSDNAKITSPTFANGIQGLKFNYYSNNTARKFKVTVYEGTNEVKSVTITPSSANALNAYEVEGISTTGATYFTIEPTTTSRRVSIGDIQVKY